MHVHDFVATHYEGITVQGMRVGTGLYLAQDSVHWRAVVKTVMNRRVTQIRLWNCIGYPRKTLCDGGC